MKNYKGILLEFCLSQKISFPVIDHSQKYHSNGTNIFRTKCIFRSESFESFYFSKKKTAEMHICYLILLKLNIVKDPCFPEPGIDDNDSSVFAAATTSIPMSSLTLLQTSSAVTSQAKYSPLINYKGKVLERCQQLHTSFPGFDHFFENGRFRCRITSGSDMIVSDFFTKKKEAESHACFLLLDRWDSFLINTQYVMPTPTIPAQLPFKPSTNSRSNLDDYFSGSMGARMGGLHDAFVGSSGLLSSKDQPAATALSSYFPTCDESRKGSAIRGSSGSAGSQQFEPVSSQVPRKAIDGVFNESSQYLAFS